jgi:molybdopterin/thiamine biosynthesis adenylyltransferase
MDELHGFLQQRASEGSISLADERAAAITLHLPLVEVEEQTLQIGIMPRRYLRNCLSCAQQLRLFRARVTIIGCGGLGGSVAELLARIGVGSLRLVDPDSFEEHNLNRQRFATFASIGEAKVEAARTALQAINPVIQIEAVQAPFAEADVLAAEVLVDGLDSAGKRHQLGELCRRHRRPLVHGAVREWYGQVGIVTAKNDLLASLYPPATATHPEGPPQVIAPTVSVISSMQAAEVCKLLLGIPSALADHWLSCNLLDSDYELIAT